MENKNMKTLSMAALIVSILPVATLIPVFLKITLSDGVRTAWAGAKKMDFLIELIVNFIGEVLEWLLWPFVNKIAARWKRRKKK